MRTAKLKTQLFVLVLISSVMITGCSKYRFYNNAINFERSRADLALKTKNISEGEIVYLDNISEATLDKEVILMIHGFGADKDNWVRFSKEITNDYRLVALDLPGHGDSEFKTASKYTIENQAKWVNEFIETLNISKAHLIGNSMGGAISLKFTRLYPEKVSSLTLVDSAGLVKTESEFLKLLKKGINPLVAANKKEYKQLMDFVMEQKPYIPGPIVKVLAEKKVARKKMDEKIFNDMLNDINQTGEILNEINIPTLIIWGQDDRVIHVDNADEFQLKIKGSQKIIFENTGHVPMLEVPEKTGSHYAKFLLSFKK